MKDITGTLIDFGEIDFEKIFTASGFVTSFLLIAAIILLRGFLIRYVRKDSEVLAKDQRRWIIRIKNTAVILMFIGLVLIWAPQLHTFALSITAFAVALVIATKEMILCLTGAIMRATSQSFKVGEWVTIDGITGEVIDLDAFSFRLQEVDMAGKTYEFTGRTITIPNSKLFTTNVENANFFKAYIFEDVRITVQYTDIDPVMAMDLLKTVAEEHFTPYRKDATEFNRRIRRRAGIDVGSAEPVYDLTTSDLGHYHFHARLFLPTPLAANIGAHVSRDFLGKIHELRQAQKQDAPPAESRESTPLQKPSSVRSN